MIKKKFLLFVIPLILSIFSATMIGVTVAQPIRDIAVTSITLTRVATGELVNVTVVVKNNGALAETFNVTLYYDNTPIENQTVTDLASGANTTLLFDWNTTDVSAGTYTIKAVASQVEDETDIENNMLASPIEVEIKSTYITVVPQSTVDTTLTPGKNYTVSIYTDYNGTDIWGYEFTLTYNPNVLQGVEVTNGDLIPTPAPNATFIRGTFNNVNGELSLTGAKFDYTPPDPAPLTYGPGTLANVTFTVVGTGDSDIELGEETVAPSRLIGVTEDGYGVEYNIIDDITPDLGHILHGYFRNTIEEAVHDIVVVSIAVSNTSVEAGVLVNVTVVIKNNGTVTETGIEVKVYYDNPVAGNLIGTQTVSTLGAGANTSLPFTWDTTGVGEGDHTVIAKATPVHGETDTEDNTLFSPSEVTVTLPPEQPLPINLIIGVVVIIVVVIAVVAYAAKRRKKPTLE